MTFEWALSELRQGKCVKRKSWNLPFINLQQNIWIDSGVLRFLFSGNLTGEDLLAEDWIEHKKGEAHAQS